MNRLRDKIVLVTGSTTGVGEATARLCVEQGACVMVHGLEEGWAQAVCAELGAESSAYAIADLGEGDNCARLEVAAHIVFWLSDDLAPANGVVYELEQYSVIGRNFAKTSF